MNTKMEIFIYPKKAGGNCWLCYSHSSYYAEVPREYLSNKAVNPEYIEYVEKWGVPVNNKNESVPILIMPTSKLKGDNYEKTSF